MDDDFGFGVGVGVVCMLIFLAFIALCKSCSESTSADAPLPVDCQACSCQSDNNTEMKVLRKGDGVAVSTGKTPSEASQNASEGGMVKPAQEAQAKPFYKVTVRQDGQVVKEYVTDQPSGNIAENGDYKVFPDGEMISGATAVSIKPVYK